MGRRYQTSWSRGKTPAGSGAEAFPRGTCVGVGPFPVLPAIIVMIAGAREYEADPAGTLQRHPASLQHGWRCADSGADHAGALSAKRLTTIQR